MQLSRSGFKSLALAVVLAAGASSVHATTLIRMGLGELVTANETIVIGEVIDAVSYWNAEGTFILTDVTLKAVEAIKGDVAGSLTVTLMGGTVGDLTSLIIGGPELIPGRSYLLFLNSETLPGAEGVTTVRDHCQGVYDLRAGEAGALQAISQANSHPLVPDQQGYLDAPGGVEGFPLEELVQTLRQEAQKAQTGQEVTP